MISLEAELLELKADTKRPAIGVVIEAKLSTGRGPVAAVLIQQGCLKVSQVAVCGVYWGRIRAMYNDRGEIVKEALPSAAVEIVGLNGVPAPGDKLFVVPDEKTAKDIVSRRKEEEKKKKLTSPAHMHLEDLRSKLNNTENKQLNIIIKADVGGTLEAVSDSLGKIESEEIKIKFIHKGVGAINSSDVILADASDAIIIGFKVSAEQNARELAKAKGIQIKTYQIIYELIDDVRAALEGMLAPHVKKVFIGRALVKKVFKLSKGGIIAGSIIEKGKISRGLIAQVMRNGEVVFEGKIQSLKRFKEDVKEVREGTECGIGVGYGQIQEGDYIDVYSEEITTRRLK